MNSRPRYHKISPSPSERGSTFHFSNEPEGEFGYYGNAFLDAARVLARSYSRRKGHLQGDKLPLLFIYRHAIELLTKAVVMTGNELMSLHDKGEPTNEVLARFKRWNHRLMPMLPFLKNTFEFAGWEWYCPGTEIETFDDLQMAFQELDAIDPNAFSFRYPVKLRGERSIPIGVEIGLTRAINTMDDLAEALDTAIFGLGAECSSAD